MTAPQIDRKLIASYVAELERRSKWRADPLSWFAEFMSGSSWLPWLSFLAALFGTRIADPDIYRRCTGRTTVPTAASREGWVIVGRRGGKSMVAALVAIYLATARDYEPYLSPGEVPTIMVISADRKQARTVMRYIHGFMRKTERLAKLIESETKESMTLVWKDPQDPPKYIRVAIEVHTCSFRAVRGYTIAGAICDEIAFWRSEDSANPDDEVMKALRPAMATIPNSMLLCIGSPYAKRGVQWEEYQKHFGQDSNVLVWQAPTLVMNPALDPAVVEEAYQRDAVAAEAEYGAQFRTDVDAYIPVEVIDANTVAGRYEIPPVAGRAYCAFLDPSGGSADSMTLGIAHDEGGKVVLDLIREAKPPFSPETVTQEFAAEMKRYGCHTATSDYYGGEWPRERFDRCGIMVTTSERTKSEIYRELLPVLNSKSAELLDNAKLKAQLRGLERRTARGGRDSIDHAPGAHDDVVNAAAGALILAMRPVSTWGVIDLGADEEKPITDAGFYRIA